MWRYIARRILAAIPVLLGALTLVFVLMRLLPGDPVELMVAEAGGSAEAAARLRDQLGLEANLQIQYLRYLGQILQGDLGRSLFTNRPVVQIILEQLPSTIELALAAMVIAVVSGFGLGFLAALNRNTWCDSLCTSLAVVGVSVPVFWSGMLFIFLFSVILRWLPATGQGSLKHLVMPAFVLGLTSAGTIARMVRSSVLEVLSQDYIITARAKGLRELVVLGRHVFKNALIPVITVIGLQFGFLLSGTVVTEMVFSRQGLGRTLVEAILWKDFPLVQGVVLLTAVIYTLVNLAGDLSYALIDPRLRL